MRVRRYLTTREKASILKNLRNEREAGHVDPEIDPWLDRFNQLPGVCTIQSCAGHNEKGREQGHLSFRFSEQVEYVFIKSMDDWLYRIEPKTLWQVYEPYRDASGKWVTRCMWVIWFHYSKRDVALQLLYRVLRDITRSTKIRRTKMPNG